MPKSKNIAATKRVTISTTPQVLEDLRRLVDTGYYGKTPAEVAERLVQERLRELGFGKVQPLDSPRSTPSDQ
jgi:hypothetical protein